MLYEVICERVSEKKNFVQPSLTLFFLEFESTYVVVLDIVLAQGLHCHCSFLTGGISQLNCLSFTLKISLKSTSQHKRKSSLWLSW